MAGLTKHQGQSTHNYRYDAYGQVLPAQGNWTDPHNHYTFLGKEWDEHLGLYEFGFRLYDPWAGVWLTREPLPGRAWEPRTWHRYQYAYASPIRYYDPYGLYVPPEPPPPSTPSSLPTPTAPPTPTPPRPPTPTPTAQAPTPTGAIPVAGFVGFRNRSLGELLAYQQDQGLTNYCASYAISTALNMLYDIRTTGMDVVNEIRAHQSLSLWEWLWRLSDPGQPQRPWPYYSVLPEGGAIHPIQQVWVVNELAPQVLERYDIHSSIRAEARALSTEEMLQILQNPNQVVLFTYPTNPKDPFKAHAVVLAAYDPPKGFGFLNSGWERKKGDLTWKSPSEVSALVNNPAAIFIKPQFVVITTSP